MLLVVAAVGGGLLACGQHSDEPEPSVHAPTAGYPATTSRLELSLGGQFEKLCHATLVDASWALTAAHCFSGVAPDGRGALEGFERNVSAQSVEFYPGAHRSGATRRDAVWESAEFVAAHDLALIPMSPPIEDIEPVSLWAPKADCSLVTDTRQLLGRFGQLGAGDRAQTAEAAIMGLVAAAELLGPEHSGLLLSARGAPVGPGDSGSGLTADQAALEAAAPECEMLVSTGNDQVLVGVIQDAKPDLSTLPFGVVPIYIREHAAWVAKVIQAKPLLRDPPRLDP